MIACRSSFRVNFVRKFTISYIIADNSLHLLQGCNGHRGLSSFSNTMDRIKKQKTSKPVWRPISTQSTSQEGRVANNMKLESDNSYDGDSQVGVHVPVVQCGNSSAVSDIKDFSKDGETTSGVAELCISTVSEVEEDANVQSVQLANESGKHSVSVEVGASLIRFIKGKGGSTQKQIEDETATKIIFPLSKQESSIVIEGVSGESITKASEKIEVILEEAVKSPNLDYSHFISLPLAIHPELVDKLMNFQNSILGTSDPSVDEKLLTESDGDTSDETDIGNQHLIGGPNVGVKLKVQDENEHVKVDITKIPLISHPPKVTKTSMSPNLSDMGIDKSIFIKPKTFHLTVLMLKLWNTERLTTATQVLQRVSSKVVDALESKPVHVRLKGLECMKGPLAKARVLYTPVEVIGGEGRLLRACQIITDAFIEAGLVLEKDARQKLKLHGTVMNARHRKRKPRTKKFDSFDARSIAEKYGGEDWGEYVIPEVHLSQRFAFDENGYYHCCAKIPLPENQHF